MRKVRLGGLSVSLAFLLLLAVLGVFGLQPARAAQPGPLLAPTPVSVQPVSGAARAVAFWPPTVITQSVGSAAVNTILASKLDLQWVFDQTAVAGAPNTTTLKLQFSNDGVNWVDGVAVVSNNSADATDMQQFAVFGRFTRVYATVSNSNPLTVTALGVVK